MPLPLPVQTSSAHRLLAPAQTLRRAPPSRATHSFLTRRCHPCIFHSPPHDTSAHFSVTPPKPASICQVPSLTSRPRLLAQSVPAVHSAFTTPRSRSFRPRRLCATPLLFLRPIHFPLTLLPIPLPPSRAPLPQRLPSPPRTHSRPDSPARPPPSRRWCGCCSWKGTVALSGCSPARGEPAGAGGEQPRRSPPAPPRPGPQAPPPLPPTAAPAIARPPNCRLASAPQRAPHSPPNPRCCCLSALGGGDRPPSAQSPHWPTDPQTPPPNQSSACSSHTRG